MVKISFKPYEELIVHEHQRFALEDLIRMRCTGMPVGSVAPNFQWAEGLVMWRETFPQNEMITKENLDGRVHWLWVGYSEMPEYKPGLVYKETSVTIPVIDLGNNPVYSAAAKWLNEQQKGQR